ncbi:MAG: GlsB/YeaQ/YmgE family stress response membrane protein [Prosthecobacter sp.]
MEFLWMLFIGLIIGIVAKFLTPGRDPQGCLVTMLIGVVGSMLAGWIGRSAGWYAQGEPVGFIASVLGASLLLLVWRMLTGRKS